MFTPIENDGKHIHSIIEKARCDNHGAETGIPCWHVAVDGIGYLAAVCGLRIRRAGYRGEISPTSLSTSTDGGRSKQRSR